MLLLLEDGISLFTKVPRGIWPLTSMELLFAQARRISSVRCNQEYNHGIASSTREDFCTHCMGPFVVINCVGNLVLCDLLIQAPVSKSVLGNPSPSDCL